MKLKLLATFLLCALLAAPVYGSSIRVALRDIKLSPKEQIRGMLALFTDSQIETLGELDASQIEALKKLYYSQIKKFSELLNSTSVSADVIPQSGISFSYLGEWYKEEDVNATLK